MKAFFVESLMDALLHTKFTSEDQMREVILKELYPYDLVERPLNALVDVNETNRAILNALLTYKASKGLSRGTAQQYLITANQLTDYIGKPLTQITSDEIDLFLMNCRKTLSPSTVKNKYQNLSSVFTTLFNHGKLTSNPMLMVDPPQANKKHKIPLTLEEIEKIKNYCSSDKRNIALMYLMLDTACRISEITNIRLEDVDFERRTIVVTGKGNKTRMVCFGEQTKFRLNEYLNERTYKSPYLFCNVVRPYGRLQKESVEVLFRTMREELNIPRLTPHLMRHTSATTLINKGLPIQEVSAYLGHANLDTTTEYVYSDSKAIINNIQKAGGVA